MIGTIISAIVVGAGLLVIEILFAKPAVPENPAQL